MLGKNEKAKQFNYGRDKLKFAAFESSQDSNLKSGSAFREQQMFRLDLIVGNLWLFELKAALLRKKWLL